MQELRKPEELERAFQDSKAQPVLIFKHSATCPISARAHQEVERYASRSDADIRKVTVQQARTISDAIAERTGIRHESPQAILVQKGKPVWNDSHAAITKEALEEAEKEAGK